MGIQLSFESMPSLERLNVLNSSKPTQTEGGYAITEVLIATAIAAGVLTAVSSALSGIVQLNARSNDRIQSIAAAKRISARLGAGMNNNDVLDGLDGWRIERTPLQSGENGETSPAFDIVMATRIDAGAPAIEFLAPRPRERQ